MDAIKTLKHFAPGLANKRFNSGAAKCFIIFRYETCFWEAAFSLRNWSQPKKKEKKSLKDIKQPPGRKARF